MPIPYPAVKHVDGDNYGYKSLISNPASMEEIPELSHEPGMKQFVAQIHDDGRPFETVRILHYFDRKNDQVSQVMVLGFIFRDRSLFSDYANCIQWAGQLLTRGHAIGIHFDFPPLLEIQPADLVEEGVAGWIMDIYVAGIGASEDEARQRLDQILATIRPLFENVA